jgi:RNA polymerase sigma-70 factor, ECF subfamily
MDNRQLRVFYKETQPKLKRWLLSRVENEADADEIVQDSYLSLLDSLPLYQGKSSLWTFLVAIAKHEVADYWRKRYAKKAILTIPFADQVYTEKLYSKVQMDLTIQGIYKQLLPHEAQILKWKYEENLEVGEIARRLKISLKAAESRLFRARQAFKAVYVTVYSE